MSDTKNISIKNIPTHILEQAKKKAKAEDRTLSQVIRELMREYTKK